MFRVLELAGLIAPVFGAVLLIAYRNRSRAAFLIGSAACLLGLGASAIGLFGTRLSVTASYVAGEGLAGVLARLDSWALLRFVLLIAAIALLVIAALVDRAGTKPAGLIAGGMLLTLAGIGLRFVEVDSGMDHERLASIVAVLAEVAETGLLGLGFLVLCVAAIAHRPGSDGRKDPADAMRSLASATWRAYVQARRK